MPRHFTYDRDARSPGFGPSPAPLTASPVSSPRRKRWGRPLLVGYLLLLAASHVVRLLHPYDGIPTAEERVVTLHAVSRTREVSGSVRVAFLDQRPDSLPNAPVVVLLHGSPGDNHAFWSVGPALARRYRVISPDLPGFGGSSHRIPDYSIRAHAVYLRQLLDSLGIAQANIVGFSMGAGVAEELAAQAPERVKSLVLLSAIGAQEYELLGDYYLNHLIHGLQLAGLILLREGIPHFGWLDDAMLSVEYARNFYDSDQRPLRQILSEYAGPMLILHGEKDPLVTPAAAREHARIVPQSQLVMFSSDHFMVFMHPEIITPPIEQFIDAVERGEATTRATASPERLAAAAEPFDPGTVPKASGLAVVVLVLLIMFATLVSEDLTCITTGLLISRGTLSFGVGTVACFLGIFFGDVLVFLCGRWLGRAVLGRRPMSWFMRPADVARSSIWFRRQGAGIVFLTRILPGTRLPTYFAAGMLRTSFWRFASYFLVACLLWTPLIVGLSALYGQTVQRILGTVRGRMGPWLLLAALVLFLLLRLLLRLFTWHGRRLLLSDWRRLTRWEFWPRWAFYPPVVVYIAYLALKHRSLTLFTAANPAIPGGGFIGESKSAILAGLAGSPELVAPHELLPAALPLAQRMERVRAFQRRHGLQFPIVLKPDVGERGAGVRIIRSEAEAEQYLGAMAVDVVVQAFAPGDEFGVFYYRYPGDAAGQIFAITEKRFTAVIGNGIHTLERLILADDRAVCMAPLFIQRHSARLEDVPAAGATVALVEIGTHCRGSAFFDGAWVQTPALAEAIDRLSKGYQGFYFGRYDIRTPSIADFQAGRNFKVVELNGATAEATSIYDPKTRLRDAYRTLFAQWRILFEIAAANRGTGVEPATLGELLRLMRKHREAVGGCVEE